MVTTGMGAESPTVTIVTIALLVFFVDDQIKFANWQLVITKVRVGGRDELK